MAFWERATHTTTGTHIDAERAWRLIQLADRAARGRVVRFREVMADDHQRYAKFEIVVLRDGQEE